MPDRERHASDRRSSHGRVVPSLLLCLAVIGLAGSVEAADPNESWAYDLAGDVMSPFCPGRTLAACPSPQAAELIQWIVLQESAGATRGEVEEQLYARYGDVIRSAPVPEGWGLAAYVIPLLAAALGIGLVVWLLRRLSAGDEQPASNPPTPAVAVDDEIERMVDRELERI